MDDSKNSTTTTRTGVHDLQAECWDQLCSKYFYLLSKHVIDK